MKNLDLDSAIGLYRRMDGTRLPEISSEKIAAAVLRSREKTGLMPAVRWIAPLAAAACLAVVLLTVIPGHAPSRNDRLTINITGYGSSLRSGQPQAQEFGPGPVQVLNYTSKNGKNVSVKL